MATLKKLFPYSFHVADLKNLIIKIVVYIVGSFLVSLVVGLLSFIPVLNILLRIIGWIVDIYCVVGIVLAVLDFLKVLK